MRLLLLGLMLSLFACNTEEVANSETDTTIGMADTIPKEDTVLVKEVHPYQDFLDFYPSFIETLQRASVGQDSINNYIHPTHGVYFIANNNGAMPTIKRYLNLAEIEADKEAKIQLFNFCAEIEKQPKFEALPNVICEDDVYDKIGCFAAESNTLSESGIWNYSNLNNKEKQAIQFAAESVEITVINTFFFTFYFSKIEGEYKVVFIDIRTLCAA